MLLPFIALLIGLPQAGPLQVQLNVDGVTRRAIVYPSTKSSEGKRSPLVLVYHGHGGTAELVASRYKIHDAWPEAVVVYAQGLPGTLGIIDPEGKQPGWQKSPGEAGDRDVKFTDALIVKMKRDYKIDQSRVYALGHSNGARFVWVLMSERNDQFAALLPACAPAGAFNRNSKAKSLFIVAGQKDPLVPFSGMKLSIELAAKLLGTQNATPVTNGYLTTAVSPDGVELATYVHPGGHEFPTAQIPQMIAFFKRHSLAIKP